MAAAGLPSVPLRRRNGMSQARVPQGGALSAGEGDFSAKPGLRRRALIRLIPVFAGIRHSPFGWLYYHWRLVRV